MVSPGPDKVPAFDGRGSSILGFGQKVFPRVRAAETGLGSRAFLLLLHMHSARRQVSLAAGGDWAFSGDQDGVAGILGVPRDCSAPDAADAIHQQGMRFTHFRRAEQSIDEFVVEFDHLRRKAESKMD